VVFRRDNKVDSFQRQMSALRHQLGNTGAEQDDAGADMPELDDDEYGADPYRTPAAAIDQDAGAYSFGTYPEQQGQGAPGRPIDDEAPDIPEMPAVDVGMSVVARETTWKGDITSENSIHIYGRVEGSLTAREEIWVAEGAEVDATLTAQRIVVAGAVSGAINASSRFEALPSGQVSADVSSPISVVHEGATINGHFKVGSGDSSAESRPDRTASVIQRRTRNAS
jgi:cytoskeletal protein CcmA (bactofilin family)